MEGWFTFIKGKPKFSDCDECEGSGVIGLRGPSEIRLSKKQNKFIKPLEK